MIRRHLLAAEGLSLYIALLSGHWLLARSQGVPWVRDNSDLLNTCLFLYIPTVPLLLTRHDLADFGLAWGGARDTGRALAAATLLALVPFLCVWALLTLTMQALPPAWAPIRSLLEEQLGRGMRPTPDPDLPGMLWFHLVSVSLPEEFFFRAYLQSRLDQCWGAPLRVGGAPVGWGLIASSAAFALVHPAFGQAWVKLDVFFPSLVFGWLRARTGSIVAPVVFHWFCNVLVLNLGG